MVNAATVRGGAPVRGGVWLAWAGACRHGEDERGQCGWVVAAWLDDDGARARHRLGDDARRPVACAASSDQRKVAQPVAQPIAGCSRTSSQSVARCAQLRKASPLRPGRRRRGRRAPPCRAGRPRRSPPDQRRSGATPGPSLVSALFHGRRRADRRRLPAAAAPPVAKSETPPSPFADARLRAVKALAARLPVHPARRRPAVSRTAVLGRWRPRRGDRRRVAPALLDGSTAPRCSTCCAAPPAPAVPAPPPRRAARLRRGAARAAGAAPAAGREGLFRLGQPSSPLGEMKLPPVRRVVTPRCSNVAEARRHALRRLLLGARAHHFVAPTPTAAVLSVDGVYPRATPLLDLRQPAADAVRARSAVSACRSPPRCSAQRRRRLADARARAARRRRRAAPLPQRRARVGPEGGALASCSSRCGASTSAVPRRAAAPACRSGKVSMVKLNTQGYTASCGSRRADDRQGPAATAEHVQRVGAAAAAAEGREHRPGRAARGSIGSGGGRLPHHHHGAQQSFEVK